MAETTADLLEDRLALTFAEALGLPEGTDIKNLKYRQIDQWDSLGHMALVAAIEDEFDVQLDTDQVIDLSSFQVAAEMLRSLGVDG